MKTTHKFLYAVAVLVALSGIAYAANAIRAAYILVYTQQASAPTGTGITGKDRVWVKSSNDHVIHTDTSNVDHDLDAASSGGATWARVAVADTNQTLTATSTAPQLAAYTSLTASRTVTITQGGTSGTPIWYEVVDESGSASSTITLTIAPSAGNIDGAASKAVIVSARDFWKGYCNGTNCFTSSRTPTSVVSSNFEDDNVGSGTTASTSSTSFSAIGNGTTTGFADHVFNALQPRFYGFSATVSGLYATSHASVAEFQIKNVTTATVLGKGKCYVNSSPVLVSCTAYGSGLMLSGNNTLRVEWRVVDAGGGTINADGNYSTWNVPLSTVSWLIF
jgi:hypothetical protein